MSKGSNSRPLSVPRDKFDAAFDAIFKKRTPEEQAKDELGPFVPLSSPPHGPQDEKP